jgi:hypothetical protein
MHVEGTSLGLGLQKGILILLCAALMLPLSGATAMRPLQQGARSVLQQGYAQTSWGLGVVVPDGATLAGGEKLNWASITNVTAEVQIPRISNASATTYAIVSLMTQDGVVLQTAFGIYPHNASWLVYSMFINDVGQYPQHYTWAINSSAPAAEPGDVVTISIYRSPQQIWTFRAEDLNASLSIQRPFGAATGEPPKTGDQEVFALESYSRDSSTFQNMRNMTLRSVFLNGEMVASGWYAFADWDARHNPLFVVGGRAPPQFLGFSILHDGSAVWYFAGNWAGDGQIGGEWSVFVAAMILLVAALGGALLSVKYLRKTGPAHGSETLGAREPGQNRLKYGNLEFRRVWR